MGNKGSAGGAAPVAAAPVGNGRRRANRPSAPPAPVGNGRRRGARPPTPN